MQTDFCDRKISGCVWKGWAPGEGTEGLRETLESDGCVHCVD